MVNGKCPLIVWYYWMRQNFILIYLHIPKKRQKSAEDIYTFADIWLAFVFPKVEINLIALSVQFVVTSAKLRHLQSHTVASATLEGVRKREGRGYFRTPQRQERNNGNPFFLHKYYNSTVQRKTTVGFTLFPNIMNLPWTTTLCMYLKEFQHGKKQLIYYPTLLTIDYLNLL